MTSSSSPRAEIQALRAAIRRHDRRYYVLDRPTISDAEYDRLVADLRRLEAAHPDLVTPDSPTRRVAGAPAPGYAAVRHLGPMLSLESVTDPADVRRFDERLGPSSPAGRPRFLVEPKFDGLSIEVIYRNGVLTRAATRGDGTSGEDVTANVKTIRAVPRRLRGAAPALLSVRGEALMAIADFRRLNRRLAQNGDEPFANPRNAAAGSVRQLDARITAGRRLTVFFYDILHMRGGPRLSDGMRLLEALSRWGLHASPQAKTVAGVDQAVRYHAAMARRRESLAYEIDGVVLKANDLSLRSRLKTTARHPRWALAFKFAPRAETTTIEDVIVQVGRTGVLTPVARLSAVEIGGVTVTRATLHNREEIARKGLRIGDEVRVARAGDVIPDIVERVRRGRVSRAIVMPSRCPACGARVVADGPFDRCPNGLACPAQLKRAIGHFGSRDALDIRGLGPETVEALVDAKRIGSVADLFGLAARSLAGIDGFAAVSAANLVAAIDRARRPALWRFLHALGIPGVGAATARDLASFFGSLGRLAAANERTLMRVPRVGPAAAKDIARFFRSPATRRVLAALSRHGVRPVAGGAARRGPLAGKTVVFTGTLDGLSRDEAEELARAAGARTSASVGATTDLVVAGANPGSKFGAARARGVRVIDERAFRRLVHAPA